MSSIKELQKEIHQIAKNKGFWDTDNLFIESNDSLLLPETIKMLVLHRQNLVISQKLMLIVSELGESLESLRNNKRSKNKIIDAQLDSKWGINLEYTAKGFEEDIKDTFEDELADSIIRILDLVEWLGIDLETHIKLKMEYNKTRPIKHNKEF